MNVNTSMIILAVCACVCDCSDTGRPVELILISTVICRLMATVAKTELETVLSGFFSSVV